MAGPLRLAGGYGGFPGYPGYQGYGAGRRRVKGGKVSFLLLIDLVIRVYAMPARCCQSA